MADNEISYSFSQNASTSVTQSAEDGSKVQSTQNDTGIQNTLEPGQRLKEATKDVPLEKKAPEADATGGAKGAEGSDTGTASDAADAVVPAEGDVTPAPDDFKADDPENVAAWDKVYRTEDGADFNITRFQQEASANLKDGKTELNANTYAYLAAKGIGRGTVDAYIADRLNALAYQEHSAAASEQQLFTTAHKVGSEVGATADGPVLLDEAIGWAAGVYTDAQKARYEKAISSTDKDERDEAVETLILRYSRTDAFKAAEQERSKASRPREPKRDATNNQGKPGAAAAVQAFENRQAWRDARKAAGNDKAKLLEVDARARASGF